MNARLAFLEVWTPGPLRRRMLDELAGRIAGAFGCSPPLWSARDYHTRLVEFVRFTEASARRALSARDAGAAEGVDLATVSAGGGAQVADTTAAAAADAGATAAADGLGGAVADPADIAGALWAAAADMGADLRRRLAVRTPEDGCRAFRLLYRHIGIDIDVRPDGDVRVRRCLFADYYSPAVCVLIGAVDDGIARGLVGRGLTFTERLTDGAGACRGHLTESAV